MKPWNPGRYAEEEASVLVEEYGELSGLRHKAWILVRLLDVERSLRRLSPPHREAIFLVGMAGLSLREAATILDVSKDTVARRYNRGIQELVRYLNRAS